MAIFNKSAPPSIEVHPYLKAGQEFTVPIDQWNALTAHQKSTFLGSNRLFLMRYNRQLNAVVSVDLRKHDDQTLIKL
jgi:hypothetical protein